MAVRRSLQDVRVAIRRGLEAGLRGDLNNTNSQYVLAHARGRALALEMLCIDLGFTSLAKTIKNMLQESYNTENQIALEKAVMNHSTLKGGI